MKNQFFYTREVAVPSTEDVPAKTMELTDSFNIEKVLRTFQPEAGKTVVVLDDLHERTEEVPNINPKNGKVGGVKKNLVTYQSEIHLNEKDSKRFINLTTIG